MQYIQRPYILILNGLQKVSGRMHEGVREAGLWACCALLAAFFPINNAFNLIPEYSHRTLYCGALIALLAFFGLKERIETVRWNGLFAAATFAFAVWLLIARSQHAMKSGMTWHALFLLTVMPCFCIVWNSRGDYSTLYDKLATTLVFVGIAAYIAGLIVFPYAADSFKWGRYTGMTWNANVLAMHNVAVVAAAAYLLVRGKKRILSAVAGGLALALIYLSVSRTALVAVVTILAAFVICAVRNLCGARRTVLWLFLGLAIMGAAAFAGTKVLSLPTERYGYRGIERLKERSDSEDKYTKKELIEQGVIQAEESGALQAEEYSGAGDHFADRRQVEQAGTQPAEQLQATEVQTRLALQLRAVVPALAAEDPMIRGIAGRKSCPVIPANTLKWIQTAEQTAKEPSAWEKRLEKSGDLEAISSGRLRRYRFVLDHLNAFGYVPEAVRELIPIGNASIHNTILEFAFYGGAPAGVAFLLIEVLAVLFSLLALFGKKRREPGAYFGVMVVCFFWIMSLTEVATILTIRNVAMMFYLIFPLLFASRKAL